MAKSKETSFLQTDELQASITCTNTQRPSRLTYAFTNIVWMPRTRATKTSRSNKCNSLDEVCSNFARSLYGTSVAFKMREQVVFPLEEVHPCFNQSTSYKNDNFNTAYNRSRIGFTLNSNPSDSKEDGLYSTLYILSYSGVVFINVPVTIRMLIRPLSKHNQATSWSLNSWTPPL